MFENKEKRRARWSLFFLLLGSGMLFTPFLINADLMKWGFACSFVGLFIGITALICFLAFRRNSIVVETLFIEENLLANWRYPREVEEWNPGKIGSIFMGCIFILIGFVVFISDTDEYLNFFIITLIFSFLLMIIGSIIATRVKENQDTSDREVWIYKQGMIFEGEAFVWESVLMSLRHVGIVNMEGKDFLTFIFTRPSRRRLYHKSSVQIPIPEGYGELAASIVGFYQVPLPEDFNPEADEENTSEDELEDPEWEGSIEEDESGQEKSR